MLSLIAAYIEAKKAERYSPRTIESYQLYFRKLYDSLGSIEFARITADDLRSLYISLDHISLKTLINYHYSYSALWNWAISKGVCKENITRQIHIRKPYPPEIQPFSRSDFIALLGACDHFHSRLRDRALLLVLLDTGVRASELCSIRLRDLDWVDRRIIVTGKGNKQRMIKFSPRTGSALRDYLIDRNAINSKLLSAHVFVTSNGRVLYRHTLRKILDRLASVAGVSRVFAHRFRHTFAIQFLRNGGNIYTLQKLLGHTTLEMVKRYLAIAQLDLDHSLDKASPVICWGL
jgi:site-specific recombinase XerD